MKRLRHIFAASVAGLSLSGCANLGGSLTPPQPVTREMQSADPALMDTAMERAKLVVHPYEEGSTEWSLLTTAEELMGGNRSGFDGALFRAGDRYAFVFYGYNERKDLGDVVKAGFVGIPKRQLDDAHDFTVQAAETYGIAPAEMEFVGHSLGGYLAKAVGLHTGATGIWAFNSPGFKRRDPARLDRLFGEDAPWHGDYVAPEVYNISSSHDVVGQWGYQPGLVFEVETRSRHHAIGTMVSALRGLNPFAADEPALHAETQSAEKPGFMARLFNRIANSSFVQKRLDKKFRSPEPPQERPPPAL